MSLNFLLGYTGVLSFGHAAYFGLGGYGTGHGHQVHLVRARRLRCLVGIVAGTLAAAAIGPLIMRACAASISPWCTIAFGQVFYYIAFQLELGHRRRRRLERVDSVSRSISASPPSTS